MQVLFLQLLSLFFVAAVDEDYYFQYSFFAVVDFEGVWGTHVYFQCSFLAVFYVVESNHVMSSFSAGRKPSCAQKLYFDIGYYYYLKILKQNYMIE